MQSEKLIRKERIERNCVGNKFIHLIQTNKNTKHTSKIERVPLLYISSPEGCLRSHFLCMQDRMCEKLISPEKVKQEEQGKRTSSERNYS